MSSQKDFSEVDYVNKVFVRPAGDKDEKEKTPPTDGVNSWSFYDFDVILKEIGGLGKYQLALITMVYWIAIPAGMTQVASVFLAATPDHRCSMYPVDEKSLYNLSEAQIESMLLPTNPVTGEPDSCRRYDYNLSACEPPDLSCLEPTPPPSNFSTIKCDNGFVYNTDVYATTITTEWNLVCDDTTIGTVVTAVYFAGILISSIIGGNVVDRYGRVPVMILTQIVMCVLGIGCAYAPSLIGFAAIRFCIALFLQPGFIACFVYNVEVVGEKWRTFVGIFVQLVFALGYMTLSGFAYQWRNWRDLQFAISFVSLPFVIFWFFIPESPRWLFDQKRNQQAMKICQKMAKNNGNELSEDVWERAEASGAKLQATTGPKTSYSPLELFKRPRMRWITINMMFNWFVNSIVYYGLSLNAGKLAGSDFLNNTLNGLVEFGAYAIIIATMDRLGRRALLSGCLFVGGCGCLASTVLTHYADGQEAMINSATAFALIGKAAVAGSFAIVYNFTAELYPTVVRSTAIGLASMAARVGSIITPFTLQLQDTIPWLTSAIFGVLALVAGGLSLLFPETAGKQLPTSLDDAEAFFRGESISKENDAESGEKTKL